MNAHTIIPSPLTVPTEAILPLGKPKALTSDNRPAEMAHFQQRTFLDWAVDEALEAGVRRLILVAAEDYKPAPVLLDHLRQRLAEMPRAPDSAAPEIILLRTTLDPNEGWDGLVRHAAAQCTGTCALLIDPLLLLTHSDRVVTSTAALLGRNAARRKIAGPVLATARLPWDAAIHMPVIGGTPDRPHLRFDRATGSHMLTVFAGRALLSLPMNKTAAPEISAWPLPYRFPCETFVQDLLLENAQTLQTGLQHVEPQALPETQSGTATIDPLILTPEFSTI